MNFPPHHACISRNVVNAFYVKFICMYVCMYVCMSVWMWGPTMRIRHLTLYESVCYSTLHIRHLSDVLCLSRWCRWRMYVCMYVWWCMMMYVCALSKPQRHNQPPTTNNTERRENERNNQSYRLYNTVTSRKTRIVVQAVLRLAAPDHGTGPRILYPHKKWAMNNN